ncbi:E3 ubiquitin-protein ligase Midline-1-like [Mytilus trossulus]|uniref:E3 ubiquitin-protein ligase Midline-1-like n=1 Tax=Mytilus trossulus TaxID=6551 RepID=UPI003004CDF0
MASLVTDYCTLCNDDGTSTEAVKWCIECEVFLCTDCEKHHKKSRSSKAHNTMSTKDYHNLPKFMQEISSQCRDHKKKYELYCSFHACPCCVTCITDKHKKCQEMKPLLDILKKVKSSASVQLFEKDLREVKENLEEIIKHLNRRINTSTIQKTKAAEQIRSMRKSIDDFLDKLEQEILDDLDSKQSKLKSQMNTLLQQLKTQANQMSQLESEFSKMTQYATELQMYVGLREIEKTTSEAAKHLEDLKSGGQLDEVNLELTISSELQSILKDVKSFGDININTSPLTLQLKAVRKDQAQYLVHSTPTIEQINPSLLRQLTIPQDRKNISIYACTILPDGKYLILDSKFGICNLLLFSNDGMFMREVVKFTGASYDSCFVRNNTVAVALNSEKQIALVDVEKNKIFKSINISHLCFSVASDGQMLVVSRTEKSTIVNLNDESHTILEGVKAYYVASFKGNIYGTIIMENKVCCYTSSGEPLWTFMHDDIISLRGITLDKNGFVYVVSRSNNRVVVVSPDGKICKTILSEADGIKDPYAIDIDRESGIMIVSSRIRVDDGNYKTAFVYKL